MATRVCQVLPVLLTIAILAAPGVPIQAQTSQAAMPAELMSALLAASSQPFDASSDGYHAH
ncbi:MAG: hypothetical protein JXB07_03880, partial [Anaerolineae bacterium]|nr:hypothetical protein [Anaerolineae bacterium]